MSWRTNDHDGQGPVRLLSLDGGGIRGLSSLIILKHLMERVDPRNPPKPCDYFQLIGGTSTGGLIAIMLGRLRMSVDECINKYLQLSAEAFKLKRSKLNLVAKGKDLWKADGKYRSETLAQEFRNAAMELEADADALLLTPDTSCRVFVCANSKTLNQPVLIRSYKTDSSVNNVSTAKCRIWEAARATSAASTFFDPIQIGNQYYVDGATGMNNPVEAVLEEAKAIWLEDARERIQCLVSIGTGVPALKDFGDNLAEIGNTLKSLATDTQRTEERFYKNHAELGVGGGRYFRFNVDNGGLSGVGLDEQEKKEQIITAAEMYLEQGRTQDLISEFLKARAPQDASVSEAMKNTYLEWLPFIDTRQHHEEARNQRPQRSTGRWFVDGEPFQDWAKTSDHEDGRGGSEENCVSTFMWLHAGAGCGKTVLTSAIIDHIERRERAPVGFLYLSFQGKDQRGGAVDLWHLKCSLLVQVLKATIVPDPIKEGFFVIPAAFRRLYNKYHPSRRPSMEDLDQAFWEILGFALSSSSSRMEAPPACYFVVDGLDEHPDTVIRQRIVAFLGEIISKFPFNTHVLVTSRPEPDISAAVDLIRPSSPARVFKLAFDKETINKDIETHLNALLTDAFYQSFQWWSDDLKKQVVSQLTEQADGVFRWADLQIRELAGKEREKDVRKALKKLPRGLEETYERMLRRIEEADEAEEAILMLSWLACAKRPLSLAELAEVVAFEVGESDDVDSSSSSSSNDEAADTAATDMSITFNPSARYKNPDSLKRILGGLATFTQHRYFAFWTSWDKTSPPAFHTVVMFAHFSVKQYLQSKQAAPAHFRLEPVQCNRLVFRCCLEYMKYYDVVSSSQVRDKSKTANSPYPLLLYAWQHTWDHALEGYDTVHSRGKNALPQPPPSPERAVQILASLMEVEFKSQDPGFSFTAAVRYAIWKVNMALDEHAKEHNVLLAYFESHEGLASVIEESTGGSSPWPIVLESLERLDQLDSRSWELVHVVAALAESSLMQILLDIGIIAKNSFFNTSILLHAVAAGETYLQDSLQAVRESNFAKSRQRGRRFVADTIKKLLDAGCTLYATDKDGRTPLHIASWYGQTATVKYLLEHDLRAAEDTRKWSSDPWPSPHERKDSTGKSPFFLAVSAGHLETVEALLEAMDDIAHHANLVDNRGRTPLIEAAAMRHGSIVKLLLRWPEIHINSKDSRGRTALLWAAWAGAGAAVDMLLAHPEVETDTRDPEGWDMLMFAAERGHDRLLQTILERPDQSDINHCDIHGRTALSWAVFRGRRSTVELLLRQPQIVINIEDKLGCSPLEWAIQESHAELAQMLKDASTRHVHSSDVTTSQSLKLGSAQASKDGHIAGGRKKKPTGLQLKHKEPFPVGLPTFGEIEFLNFSHDGRRLAIGKGYQDVEIWDMASNTMVSTLSTPGQPEVFKVSWSPDDTMIVTCAGFDGAQVWDVDHAACLLTVRLDTVSAFDSRADSSVWSPDGKWFIVGFSAFEGSSGLWRQTLDPDGIEKHTPASHILNCDGVGIREINDLEMLADGKQLAVLHDLNSITLLDIDSISKQHTMTLDSVIDSMCKNKDSSQLLVACASGELLLIDPTKEMSIMARYLGGKGGDYRGMWRYRQQCSFGGGVRGEDFVLNGSPDGSILIWNKETTELLIRLEAAHLTICSLVAWSPVDPFVFVSGGGNPAWKIWEVTYSDPPSPDASTAPAITKGVLDEQKETALLVDFGDLKLESEI